MDGPTSDERFVPRLHSSADFAAFVGRHPGLKENSDSTFTTRT